jgi:hypothetical protein
VTDAYASTTRDTTLIKGLSARLARLSSGIGTGIGEGLVDLLEDGARLREVARMRAMSDAELAIHGITRDDIIPHVFRGRFRC